MIVSFHSQPILFDMVSVCCALVLMHVVVEKNYCHLLVFYTLAMSSIIKKAIFRIFV
jgi:hypothetical protein